MRLETADRLQNGRLTTAGAAHEDAVRSRSNCRREIIQLKGTVA
ncbi:uncharacterized protein METZ01_LOCUS309230 [marine metagenome]|uniref:Uncharacterized protein n=1 Tax=marine metagenome TaxID=408172 RepID=A0A382N5M6_9ZZZZ